MQALDGADQLGVQVLLGLEVLVVLVAREDFIRTLAGQDNLHVPRGKLGQDVVRHRAPHERRVKRLYGAHYPRQDLPRVLGGIDTLVVLGIEVLGYGPGRQEVRGVFKADGEGHKPRPVTFGPPGRYCRDEAGVEAAGKENADRHVAHHLPLDGFYKTLAHAGQDLLRYLSPRLRGTVESSSSWSTSCGTGRAKRLRPVSGVQ